LSQRPAIVPVILGTAKPIFPIVPAENGSEAYIQEMDASVNLEQWCQRLNLFLQSNPACNGTGIAPFHAVPSVPSIAVSSFILHPNLFPNPNPSLSPHQIASEPISSYPLTPYLANTLPPGYASSSPTIHVPSRLSPTFLRAEMFPLNAGNYSPYSSSGI